MKKIAWSAAASAALVVLSAGAASAADMDSMVTKAPRAAAFTFKGLPGLRHLETRRAR
jgi:hypothetical protein